MAIFWIDEDSPQFEFDRERLRARGSKVDDILDATTAYARLTDVDPNHVTGMIVDVMLRPGSDLGRFSPEKCDGTRRVGLILIDELNAFWGERLRRKFIIYTCATAEDIRGAIRATQKRFNIPVLPKSPDIVGSKFAKIVLNYFKSGEIEDEFIRR
ncbi:hypothetical protein QA649_17810 [Bradyrhizobium sp. CB1717]|uniref:hypothetical protein n=1 Tax=Bradyrhizobium sp. CB1717 TaxID=3039154 RepID=UPI0024B159C6|nr:hypothetical protein [Bradyrhizobium sp. CB1717]WFU28004.1 hypothetical protein QA649_17810 [Bradyrhizobium sp. CB1717]